LDPDARRAESSVQRIEPHVNRLLNRVRALELATRPDDPEVELALARRWDELPEHVRTPGQLLGRRIAGCEGTHGVFPACDFACKPCYHSVDANRVPIDGAHTTAVVEAQMAYFRAHRGPVQHAQLIGGEVSLLSPEDHAATIEVMRSHGRMPMSFTHGDFDYEYLQRLAVRPDGSRRFDVVSFAGSSIPPTRPTSTRTVPGSARCSTGSKENMASVRIWRTT
jgi:hypothetical protein